VLLLTALSVTAIATVVAIATTEEIVRVAAIALGVLGLTCSIVFAPLLVKATLVLVPVAIGRHAGGPETLL